MGVQVMIRRAVLRRVCLVLAMIIACACMRGDCQKLPSVQFQSGSSLAGSGEELRPFTVADSIAMVHFAEPDEHMGDHPLASPDGRRFLVVTERGILASNTREYSLLVFRYDKLGEHPEEVAIFSSSSNRPGISQAKWLDDEHISLIGENPGEMPQVYVVNCKRKNALRKTQAPSGVVGYDISHDQRKLAYYAVWESDAATHREKEEHGFAVTEERLEDLIGGNWGRPPNVCQLYIKDLVSGKTLRVGSPNGFSTALRRIWISPDGRYAVADQSARTVPKNWALYQDKYIGRVAKDLSSKNDRTSFPLVHIGQAMLIDMRSGQITPLIDAPMSDNSWMSAVWSRDSRSVIVGGTLMPLDTTDKGELAERKKGQPAVVEVDLPSKASHAIIQTPIDQFWEIRPSSQAESFSIARWRDLTENALAPLVFHRQRTGWSEERDVTENKVRPEITITEASDRWPVLVLVDRTTHQRTVILDPNPQLKHVKFGRQEVIRWTGKMGEPLEGGLYYPTAYVSGIRYPLVIQTHGFTPTYFLPDGPYCTVFAAQELANRGVVVLQLGKGPFYEKSKDTPDFGPFQLSQIDSAVDYLDRLDIIDPSHVGLVGFSITGFQVTYALTHSSHHFAVATSAEGNDWGYWSYVAGGNQSGWATQSEALFGGPPWDGNWQSWIKDSITFRFDKIHTPLRLESDSNDFGTVINEWEKFIALKREHKPVELIYLAHGSHPLVKPWDRMTSQQGNVDWLLFWLKGEEDPNPSKAAQYTRWRGLRILQDSQQVNLESKEN